MSAQDTLLKVAEYHHGTARAGQAWLPRYQFFGPSDIRRPYVIMDGVDSIDCTGVCACAHACVCACVRAYVRMCVWCVLCLYVCMYILLFACLSVYSPEGQQTKTLFMQIHIDIVSSYVANMQAEHMHVHTASHHML